MPFVSPTTAIINTATQYLLAAGDTVPWYRGLRHVYDNKSPPRYVYGPVTETYGAGDPHFIPSDDQNFVNPRNKWIAKERLEVHVWGRDLDDVWIRKSNAIRAIDQAMALGRGSWRIPSATYVYSEKAVHVDRGEHLRMVFEFDIPQEQNQATEVIITSINIIGEIDFPDETTVTVFNTTV